MIKDENFRLANGVKIPAVGFGTWQTKDGEEAYRSVLWALEAGYRHIDTAYAYGNEKTIGKAIKDSGIRREDIFLTTKLPADQKSYEACMDYFERSRAALGVDYIDLYLIHAPWPWTDVGSDHTAGNIGAWKAMIDLYNAGKVRSIGVSNFHQKDIEALIQATGVTPMVNQIRYFIGNTQPAITEYCQANAILIEAYSPFATGELIDHPALKAMAEKYHTTIPKICLRYCIEKGTLPLPKSVHKERIFDNIDFDFAMDPEDVAYLDSIGHIASIRPFRS